jgi:putative redox protein
MQALAFGLAGCMAMDVVHVITKGRHELRGLRVDLTGTREQEVPRRFTAVTLHFTITGNVVARQVLLRLALLARGHPARHHV